jgi:hypothetical protein
MSGQLRSVLEKTVEEYNRYRSPEAVARIVRADDDGFTLEFSGPFCQSCGVHDYFEDMIFELERLSSMRASLQEIQEIEEGVYQVRYLIDRQFHSGDEDGGAGSKQELK